MEDKETPVCRDLFESHKKCDDVDFDEVALLEDLHDDDVRRLEDLILQFSAVKPMPSCSLTQCTENFEEAQQLLLDKKYGIAIARFKNIVEYAQSLPFDNATEVISVGETVFARGLAHERIALSQLLKDNPRLCVKHANRSIVETPHLSGAHLWRAIGNRRRGCTHEALKSLTCFAAISEINPDAYCYLEHEQCVINKYWRTVFDDARKNMLNIKTFFMEVRQLAYLDAREQAEVMSEMILDLHPTHLVLIHSDSGSIHYVPEDSDSVTYFSSTTPCRQAYSFQDPDRAANYFANLPKNIGSGTNEIESFQDNSDVLKEVWEASIFLNSTNPKVSLETGRGISEHIHYCMTLAKEQRWYDALFEFGNILADLSVFPLLSELDWSTRLEAEVDWTVNQITEIVSLIECGMQQTGKADAQICATILWLEKCERKFRANKCKQASTNGGWKRNKKTPKIRQKSMKSANKS